ncbi:MAG: hypothetical protein H6508_01700 [Calditrichaeota bacterium]|nr:hypothetical protein [Calditrichota bacterium]
MALLNEYAIGPRVFYASGYSSTELGDICLAHLREAIFDDGFVRNLRKGDWLKSFTSTDGTMLKYAKEILSKLSTQGRLRLAENALELSPTSDVQWCNEAVESHRVSSLLGVVACEETAVQFDEEPIVAAITRLSATTWWKDRSNSVRLTRTNEQYATQLGPFMIHANSLMLIDPHLDPGRGGYRGIIDLILLARNRSPVPRIEIHRASYIGNGNSRRFPTIDELEGYFRADFATKIRDANLSVEVFIWDDFHDRYLISNLAGVLMANGFDTTNNPNSHTTWTRLGRNVRDDVQREFDPAANRHVLKHRFVIP